MHLWPLKGTSDSSSLQFCRQHGDAPGVRLSPPNIRKIIMISLYTFVSSCPGGLWWASVSMGVIRRVGLTSRLMRREFSRRGRGEPRRGPSLTTSTIGIIIITTHTRCSGEMLLPVKQQKGPRSPTMCRCVFVSGVEDGGGLCICAHMHICVCVHLAVYIILCRWLLTPFPSRRPSIYPSSISHCITPYIHEFPVYHENLCMKIEGGKAGKKAKKNNRKKINRGECW